MAGGDGLEEVGECRGDVKGGGFLEGSVLVGSAGDEKATALLTNGLERGITFFDAVIIEAGLENAFGGVEADDEGGIGIEVGFLEECGGAGGKDGVLSGKLGELV